MIKWRYEHFLKINHHYYLKMFRINNENIFLNLIFKGKEQSYDFWLFSNAEHDQSPSLPEARCQFAAPFYSFVSLFCASVLINICFVLR